MHCSTDIYAKQIHRNLYKLWHKTVSNQLDCGKAWKRDASSEIKSMIQSIVQSIFQVLYLPLHAYITRARLTACEVGVFSEKYHNLWSYLSSSPMAVFLTDYGSSYMQIYASLERYLFNLMQISCSNDLCRRRLSYF